MYNKFLSPAAEWYLNTGSSRLLFSHCCPSGTLPPSQRGSTTSPPNPPCMCPNVNAGTHSNCIQHQLIWFFKKSRWAQNPCWWMDWWTGLLCLVSLSLIFLLLLLLPLPLHCGVYLLFSETGWMCQCWCFFCVFFFKWVFRVESKTFSTLFQPVVWFTPQTAECSSQTPPQIKLNFFTFSPVLC